MDNIRVQPSIIPTDDGPGFAVGAISLDIDPFSMARLAIDTALDLLAICKEIAPQISEAWPRVACTRFDTLYAGSHYHFEPLQYAYHKAILLYSLVATDVALGERRLLMLVNEMYQSGFSEPDVNRRLITDALSAIQKIHMDILRRQRDTQGENWRRAFPDPHWDDMNERFLAWPKWQRDDLIAKIRQNHNFGHPDDESHVLVREQASIDLGRLAAHWPEEAAALAEELGLALPA